MMLRYTLILTFISLVGCTNQNTKNIQDELLSSSPETDLLVKDKPVQKSKPTEDSAAKSLIEQTKNYHANGQLAYVITYKNNIKVNQENYTYYKSGELSIQSISVGGLKQGLVSHYSKNGDIWRTQQYQKGKKHGFSISYYTPGVIAKKSHFKNGLPEGTQEAFSPNGQRSDKWIYQQGRLLSHFKFQYFENGNLHLQHAYLHGKKNGLSQEYSETGQLISSVNYANNLRHGKTLTFYDNGLIKEEQRYQYNQQHGGSSGYYLSGELHWQSYYQQGLREGIYNEYYQHGQLKKQITYHHDKQNGAKRFFHENGFLKYELTMKDSKADGLLKEFDDQGNLKVARHYNNGKVSKENSSFLNGYFLWLSENEMEKLIN